MRGGSSLQVRHIFLVQDRDVLYWLFRTLLYIGKEVYLFTRLQCDLILEGALEELLAGGYAATAIRPWYLLLKPFWIDVLDVLVHFTFSAIILLKGIIIALSLLHGCLVNVLLLKV